MKIPETSANVGAYYGNEENGQWQPNGVIIDNGVGGGVVGSGDAGIHRPPVYPVHIPRGHVPAGYVMAGAYYPPAYPPVPAPQDDFADYMWMENEEEFDKQVMQQLEEEALMEQCIEAMLEDEQRERRNAHQPTTSNGGGSLSLEETVSRSTLNPLAAEFVPTRVRAPPAAPEDKPETESTPATEEAQPQRTDEQRETQPDIDNKTEDTTADETNSEDSPPPPKEPPEVSAADIISNKNTSKVKKVEPKKPIKLDVKKTKPLTVKSDTKVQPKKKDVKVVKSEVKLDEDSPKLSAQVTPTEETSPTGLKPINYAAAAKASKPKQKSVTPPLETPKPSTTTKTDKPIDKKPLIKDKPLQKEKVQRKNSAK